MLPKQSHILGEPPAWQISIHNFIMDSVDFLEVERFARGTSAECFLHQNNVFKIMDSGLSDSEVERQLQNRRREYSLLKHSELGPFVVDTDFDYEKSSKGYFLVARQPFINGMSMKNAIDHLRHLNMDPSNMILFLETTLRFYEEHKIMPDIFGRPHVTNWYLPETTPNVIVEERENFYPKLVDVGFARLSKFPFTAEFHNSKLAAGVRSLIAML